MWVNHPAPGRTQTCPQTLHLPAGLSCSWLYPDCGPVRGTLQLLKTHVLEEEVIDHPGSIAKLVFPTECFLQNRPIKKTQDVEEVKKLDYFLSPGVRGCLTHRLLPLYRPHSCSLKAPGQRGPKCKICRSSPATDWS